MSDDRASSRSSQHSGPFTRIQLAQFRAHLAQLTRSFFSERGLLEVETPLLSNGVSTDRHLGFFSSFFHPDGHTLSPNSGQRFLQTSPEPHLKRLLCEGFPDVWQLCKAFRNGESGRCHNPEFSMVEWYRCNFSLLEMVQESLAFCKVLIGERPVRQMTWREAGQTYLGFDPLTLSLLELQQLPQWEVLGVDTAGLQNRADLFDLLMSRCIEPSFDAQTFTVITAFPAEQAAQALLNPEDLETAQRFEIYSGGMELGNGYQELRDAQEYRQRFETELILRKHLQRPVPPLDERLLHALVQGLPNCCGVAMGWDRLVMLALGVTDLRQVLLFPWEES